MKKNNFAILLLMMSVITIKAQVGVNTPNPTSTMDITAKNATGATTNVDGLLVPRVDRQRAQSMTGVPTSTLIYVNNIATGAQAGIAVNVDTVGYYYYNGTVWVKLASGGSIDPRTVDNIYTNDGTLLANRTVIQANKTLTFTGNQTNAFSVDGSSFSVDAANHRVGIGTANPANKFVVKGANAQPTNTNATLRVDGDGNHALDVGTLIDSPYGAYINSKDKNSGGGLPLGLNPSGGNVGVGTLAPSNKLHVKSSADPLKLEGVGTGSKSDKSLVIDGNGVVKTIESTDDQAIPSPTLLTLKDNISNFLNGKNIGESQVVSMEMLKNKIDGLTYTASNHNINFPPGTYQITMVYEADHNADCTVSSYFFDFPNGARVHSTASHGTGTLSNHGGSITYALKLPNGGNLTTLLGRGQSGNCKGPGMTLRGGSTQLLIFRLGN